MNSGSTGPRSTAWAFTFSTFARRTRVRCRCIMLYWLPNIGASSARLYWENMGPHTSRGGPTGPMTTPAGISMFSQEQVRVSQRWAESRFANLIHFNELDEGGHFAALEQPDAFVDEVRMTFRSLR